VELQRLMGSFEFGPDLRSLPAVPAGGAAVPAAIGPSGVGVHTPLEVVRSAVRPATVRLSVVIPCLNEAESIEACVTSARRVLDASGIAGEVIVVDNGSEDGSDLLARRAGATVVKERRRGYGNAYLRGFDVARGEYIVMIDADLTYDFEEIPRFVAALDDGADFVMGNRMGDVRPGAMSALSRLGNPVLSGFLNLLFRTPVGDAHCGMRALRRDVLPALGLQAPGMELASEMVIRAVRADLEIRELPIALHPREGESKLAPFRDGWRHLRLMLVYHPSFLFVYPGVVLGALGTTLMGLVFAHASLFGRAYYVHTLIGGSMLVVVSTQLIGFGLCGRAYAVYQLGDRDRWLDGLGTRIHLEHGLMVAIVLMACGVGLGGVIVGNWVAHGLGGLAEERLAIVAATLMIVGVQVFFTAFMLSVIGLRRRAGERQAVGR
jgi:glycosyltransferase involved in cell wall biosynthesis